MRTHAIQTKATGNGGSDAQRLKQLMAETGYVTNQQLAADMGVSVNTVTNWITGKTPPQPAVMRYLALKRDVKRLVG